MRNDVSKVAVTPDRASRSFVEYFRCPDEFAPFEVVGNVQQEPGFFKAGEAICFGTSTNQELAKRPDIVLSDQLRGIEPRLGGNYVPLTFNPSEVAENLRRELYLSDSTAEKLQHSLYYLFRPFLPAVIRRPLQRWLFERRRAVSFPRWPLDCSVDLLFESLMKLAIQASPDGEVPFVWFWPQGKKTAVVMSHDVEDQIGADACEMLMEIDSSFGIKAAFHFIPETRYPERFESLVSRARARGFEANIHDLDHDGRLFVSEELFSSRAKRINEYARKFKAEGFRAGSMHRNQDWIERLDFQYDMSVPNVAHLEPQKGGCCTVLPYFLGQTVEMPLTTIQDYALFKILHNYSIDLWKQQIQDISARHGLISFIVHPDYITETREKDLYCELLAYLSKVADEQNFWMAFPSEINRWWRERNQMTLVREGNDWVVTGPGSERALVAYASLAQGKLTYRIRNEVSSVLA